MNSISMLNKVCLVLLAWVSVIYASCPTEWIPYNNHCYLVNKHALSHADAEAECKASGATLLVIDDPDEFDFWANEIKSENIGLADGSTFSVIWIGATRSANSGPFQWSTGGTLAANNINWASDYPYDKNNTCVVSAHYPAKKLKYENKGCGLVFESICEKAPEKHSERKKRSGHHKKEHYDNQIIVSSTEDSHNTTQHHSTEVNGSGIKEDNSTHGHHRIHDHNSTHGHNSTQHHNHDKIK